jgi:site-specific DNA recombinase
MKREKINVVLYLRVSTEEQAERGHSLKQQEEALVSYCNKMGYCILKIYSEDHSAKNFNRPEWTLLKAFVKANKKDIDKVLFTKWDRFSRNIEQAYVVLSELRRSGVDDGFKLQDDASCVSCPG